MMQAKLKHFLAIWGCSLCVAAPGAAQTVETVGSRALGMGGAFVAVASDNSATWWNPAGLATGPFLDVALARAVTDKGEAPAVRDAATWFALATPPFGISYYRLRITDIGSADPTVTESGSREDQATGLPPRTLEASQLGVTLVQSLLPGVHAGATLKYVRGRFEGGDREGAFDADVGLIGVAGPLRTGVLIRNLRDPRYEHPLGDVRLGRQVRLGAAYDAEAAGGPRLTVGVDVDVRRVRTFRSDRRNVAVGAEHWFGARRVAVRGGARFNTVGARERAATGGASVAVRAGLFLDAHLVRGGTGDDRGWGLAARVAF